MKEKFTAESPPAVIGNAICLLIVMALIFLPDPLWAAVYTAFDLLLGHRCYRDVRPYVLGNLLLGVFWPDTICVAMYRWYTNPDEDTRLPFRPRKWLEHERAFILEVTAPSCEE